MGRTLLRLVAAQPSRFRLSGALTVVDDPRLGEDAGRLVGGDACGVRLVSEPEAALAGAGHLQACREAGVALVLGTTGLDAGAMRLLGDCARVLPLVYARNFSVGVTLLGALARLAAERLGEDYDAEIIEAHHRAKLDAPSGTALALGEAVATGRGRRLDDVAQWARHGHTGPREPGGIGFAVVRAGSIVGDHTVLFASDEERLELTHRASDRSVFARGALRAAQWLAGRPAGLYDMYDVLGLDR
jgi:4-hydroxy-tetrahydrodipicolinate reductase